jgi:hypothetical protein
LNSNVIRDLESVRNPTNFIIDGAKAVNEPLLILFFETSSDTRLSQISMPRRALG